MRNAIKYFTLIAIVIVHYGCSPVDRFIRLTTKYPFLLESVQHDTVIIRNPVLKDTQIIWKKQIDTFVFSETKIERRNDTLKFYFRERPCTTYINKTEIKPSKYVEKVIKNESDEKERYYLYGFIILLVIIVFLTLLK
jgi:hypothetical protein